MASGTENSSIEAVRFDRATCGNPAAALQLEWLETNGLGGFASATIAGANTRRYHGLLVAAADSPDGRCVLLSKLEETVIASGEKFELSTNIYPNTVHPAGYQHLTEFRLDPFPVSVFEAAGTVIEKRVFMAHGENTVVVEYTSDTACRLELRPLIAFRGYHALTHANSALNGLLEESAGLFSMQPYDELPRVHVAHNAASLKRRANWYYNFEYPVERERGLDFREDLFCPCVLVFELAPGKPAIVVASTRIHSAADAESLKTAEVTRRGGIPSLLERAAGQFIVRRGIRETIFAGYPWFEDWGRDAMISLPGLALSTGRFDLARDILQTFAGFVNEGMLPNTLPAGTETPVYNTADATLWLFEAVRQYLEFTGDSAFVHTHFYETFRQIVDWHVRGTRFGIRMDTDGLLTAGNIDTQLTWMDARVAGQPVTPRHGKPVEIQALWHNALRFTAQLAKSAGDEDVRAFHDALAARAAESFNAQFWNPDAGYYYDVIDGARRDASLRPNQLIALSLGYCAADEEHARQALAAVEARLLTPFGLRTLDPLHPGYLGRYEGPPEQRDAAYHQGTVWPWLLGPFISADIRFNGRPARDRASALLDPLRSFAASRGAGQIPEIFDGDFPHTPRGCYAQAWSVAEILRMSKLLSPHR